MILRQFVSNQPFLMVVAPLISGGVLIPAGYSGRLSTQRLGVPGDALFLWCGHHPLMSAIVATILITLIAWSINGMFNRYEFYSAAVFVPSLLCTTGLVVSSLYSLNLPVLLSFLLVLGSLHRLLGVYRQPVVLRWCFESALFAGIAALVYPASLGMLPGLLLALAITRTFNWREFTILILGYGIPFLYWLVYKFWFRETDELYLFIRSWDNTALQQQIWSTENVWFMSTGILVMLLALPRYYFPGERLSNRSQSTRRVFMVMALAFASAVPVAVFLLGGWSSSLLVLMFAVVVSAWFSNYRFSLLAPFAFYAWLGVNGWLIWKMWTG